MIDRRVMLTGGLAAAGLAAPGWSALATRPLFARTALADNPVARHFERIDLRLPDVAVVGAQGPASLRGIGGKTRLLAIWAEWCVPCLVEIRDFGRLRDQVANEAFDIGLVATASGAAFDRARAGRKLAELGASSLPLLIEANGGARIAEALATPGGGAKGFSLPCTLLVDAGGRVRGRAFGAPAVSPPGGGKAGERRVLTDADKAALLANGRTGWSSPEGVAFLRALADGLLDRV